MTGHPPPPTTGWQPDPTGRFEQRFGCAGRWTSRVRVGSVEAIDVRAMDTDEEPSTAWQDVAHGEWRQDPAGRFDQRWWSGTAWSRKVRWHGNVATDTQAAPVVRRTRRRGSTDPDAPGWRADPDGHGQRYWNGHDWTAKHRDGPPPPSSNLRGWWSRTLLRTVVALGLVALVAVVVVVLAAT